MRMLKQYSSISAAAKIYERLDLFFNFKNWLGGQILESNETVISVK